MAQVADDPRLAAPDRVPPQNIDAEQSVLGSMMLSNDALVAVFDEHIEPEDFYRGANGTIFAAIHSIYARGNPVDAITVVEELKRSGDLDRIGGHLYIHDLVQNVGTPASAGHYARIVGELALLRRLIEAAGRIMADAYASADDPEQLADEAGEAIYRVARRREQDEVVPMRVMVDQAMTDLEHAAQRESAFAGIPTQFTDLDKLTAGLQKGNLIVVAARPGVGKSSFVTNVARNIAVDAETPVAMFSLEMARWEIGMRMLCAEARVPWDRVRGRTMNPEDWSRISNAAETLHDAPFYVVDSGAVTIVDIRAKARLLRQKRGLGMIIVDYLQLMSHSGRVESRQQEIAEISRGLKVLAKELEIPVIAVSQLNRDPERRQDKRPQLSDLRECATGETLVCLADGRRAPIRELVGTTPEVVAVTPEGRLVTAASDKVWSVGSRPVFAVRLESGRVIRVTARHLVLTSDGWVRVHDLEVGDALALAGRLPEPADVRPWPDDRVALLAHLLIGGETEEGAVRYRTGAEANARVVTSLAERAFGASGRAREGDEPAPHEVLIVEGAHAGATAETVADWLHGFGIKAGEPRRVPQEIFRLPNEQVAVFLRHLWAAGGRITREAVMLGGVPRGFAEDVAALLLRLGVVAALREVRAGDGAGAPVTVEGAAAEAHCLEVVGAAGALVAPAEQLALVLASLSHVTVGALPREVFGKDARSSSERGLSERMAAALRGATSDDLGAADLVWDRVEAVEIDGDEEVFDLTVPGPESWLADGIVSHNSGAIEQDADIVMFIHRDDSDDPSVKGTADLIVAKHRNGPTGVVKLTFLPSLTQFKNFAPAAQGPPAGNYGPPGT